MTSPYASGVVGTFPLSGNSSINPLAWPGFKWGSSGAGTAAAVTYSFPTYNATWSSDYSVFLNNEPFNNFQPFDAAQQNAARQALALWSEVANITFTEVDDTAGDVDVGDIRFGNSGSVAPFAAWAYIPFEDYRPEWDYPENGDVWFNYQEAANLELAPGEFGFSTMIHEIGHAIGLDHPFADGYGEPVLPAAQNNQRYTIMAYDLYSGATIEAYGPMLYDILALQYIYGANMTTHDGNDVYTFQTDKEYLECIWDAKGHDTIDLSNQTRDQVIDLRAGTFSSIGTKNNGQTGNGNVSIAFNVTIEDAIGGSGHDKITGNNAANSLDGGIGNDTLAGGAGNDTLDGGTGIDSMAGGKDNDLYIIDNALDKAIEVLAEGTDTIESSVTYSMVAAANVEILELVGIGNLNGTGNTIANTLIGNAGNNVLDGGAGNDTLDGAGGNDKLLGNIGDDVLVGGIGDDWLDGGAGNDKMKGSVGNDTYVIDAATDVLDEQGNADKGDLVRSTISVNLATLAAGLIENAVLLGTGALNATGNAAANNLTGNVAANILDGGVGADILAGGNGADTYIVDNFGDQVKETTGGAAGGIDLVKSSLSFALGANVENLTLTGAGDIKGFGNDLNNILLGNNGANRLDGGAGNDTMAGGKGNDTYVVNAVGDVVNETVLNSAGGGVDTVESAITFSLATRTNIENLTLLGTGKINGTGNALANIIIGNSNDNILDGGVGADTLKGGAGNDTYIVNSLADLVDEQGNIDSADEIKTSALITSAIAGVENYTFTGATAWSFTGSGANNKITGGAYNDTLNGADGNDTLLGNGGNDTLLGGIGNDWLDGGVGIDKLKGGAGNDTYVYAAGDIIDEESNTDTDDLVRTAVTVNLLTLASGAIENAILLGATAINATGNNADNELTGNIAANILNGGVGADIMAGGNGADTYIVDNLGDQVKETTVGLAGGIDLVKSSVSLTLGANVENLTLTGVANIDAFGNTQNNILIGNSGANHLEGGVGSDTMTGGQGNDTYVVDSAGDIVNETVLNSAGGGVDTVESFITFSLATRTNVENLNLMGVNNINGTGNALDNHITGNSGNNTLDGGAGNDTLVGAAGNDSLTGGTGNDFLHGGDGIDNLNGGAGVDTFDYDTVNEAGDTIVGFVRGVGGDILNLKDLLDDFGIAGSAFDGGYLDFFASGTNTVVRVDGNGGMNDVTILATLLNVTLLETDSANFVLT